MEQARTASFTTGDAALLADVYAAGSAPLARDSALLAELGRDGLHVDGLRLVIDEIAVEAVEPPSAALRVTDRLPPYTVLDEAGAVVEQVPGRGPVTWLLTLALADGAWRISEVVRL